MNVPHCLCIYLLAVHATRLRVTSLLRQHPTQTATRELVNREEDTGLADVKIKTHDAS
jgi:hypothetical protein